MDFRVTTFVNCLHILFKKDNIEYALDVDVTAKYQPFIEPYVEFLESVYPGLRSSRAIFKNNPVTLAELEERHFL